MKIFGVIAFLVVSTFGSIVVNAQEEIVPSNVDVVSVGAIIGVSDKLVSEDGFEGALDRQALVDHFYDQMRSRIRFTRDDIGELDEVFVEKTARAYIEKMYVPALTQNYVQLYNGMKEGGKALVACGNDYLSAFLLSGINAHLCVDEGTGEGRSSVVYSVHEQQGKEYSVSARFIFSDTHLVGVDLVSDEGAEYFIEGL